MTIRSLAKLAGVAPSTVSRALRDDPTIGAAMRARIHALAREHHYRPNQLMQSLLTRRSGVIGMVLPRVSFPYCARMLSAVLESALDAEYRLLIFETHGQPGKTQQAVHALIEQRVDGVLLYTGHLEPLSRDLIIALRSHDITPVGIDATISEIGIDIVQTDEVVLAELVVNYLLPLGHRHIAYIGPQYHHHQIGRDIALAQLLQRRLLPTQFSIDTAGKTYEHLNLSAIMARLLAFHPRPTAVIAWEDHIAAKVMEELTQRGIRIPDEMSLIGCGNLPISQFTTPRLTTIEQHPDQVGQHAFALLLSRMQASEETTPVANVAIPPHLIKRASCARLG